MEPCIRMNTEFTKEAKSEFETNFYKLMSSSVFGKTMENLRNRVSVKIVRSWETDKIRAWWAAPRMQGTSSSEITSTCTNAAALGQADLHRHDDLREQQDFDVRLLLQPDESPIRAKVRADLHRHRQPAHGDRDGRRLQRHGGRPRPVRYKILSQRASALQQRKPKGAGENEGRVSGKGD